MPEQRKRPAGTSRGQGQETSDTINSRFYNTRKDRALQASVYPPGWLLARLKQAPPANPITRRQGLALLNCIRVLGLEKYRGYKVRLGIPLDTPLPRLSKAEAWRLIDAITADLEASRS